MMVLLLLLYLIVLIHIFKNFIQSINLRIPLILQIAFNPFQLFFNLKISLFFTEQLFDLLLSLFIANFQLPYNLILGLKFAVYSIEFLLDFFFHGLTFLIFILQGI